MKEAGYLWCFVQGESNQVSSGPSHCARNWNGNLLENVGFASGGLNTGFLCLGNLGNVAIHGILYQLSQ